MLTLSSVNPDKWLKVWLLNEAAKDCKHIWSKTFSRRNRGAKAMKMIDAWLKDQSRFDRIKFFQFATGCAEICLLDRHSNINLSASEAIADALYAVCGAYPSRTMSFNHSANALQVNEASYANEILNKHLTFIIDYKLKSKQGFGDIEAVFDAASEGDKERLLFHLNPPKENS